MIVLGNQLALQFAIGNKENIFLKQDFLEIEDFQYMRIAENGGGLRPIINLTFQVNHEDVIPYLNTGNIITIMYGIQKPSSKIMQFEILGDNKSRDYHVGSTVSILGGLYNRGFTDQIKSDTFLKKKSYEVLRQISAQNGFNFITNSNIKTNDAQNWYQSGMKDWQMTNFVANRAYKDSETFFVYGFDSQNFYFYDLKQHLANGIKWFLSVTSVGQDECSNVVNIGTYSCDDSNAGSNAKFAGKNITNVCYNLDTGEFSNPKYQLKTFTTMDTNSVNVNSTDCINYNYQITTSDEHNFSVEAQNQNFRNNVLYSSYTCHVPVTGQYREFQLFDVVQLIPADKDKEAEGIYFISGIAKEYKDMQYTTILTLNRESANGIKGDLDGGISTGEG